ncbi:MAG: hypothetical protein KatS3mg008_0455 [Acidimicrobiales bacterium]|nr:MAG: hypothetical protein KatS3mg008_0455 [Acidimicrobiales bacterium]
MHVARPIAAVTTNGPMVPDGARRMPLRHYSEPSLVEDRSVAQPVAIASARAESRFLETEMPVTERLYPFPPVTTYT